MNGIVVDASVTFVLVLSLPGAAADVLPRIVDLRSSELQLTNHRIKSIRYGRSER